MPHRLFSTFEGLTAEELKQNGIRLLFLDIDNTLAPYEQPTPPKAVKQWLSNMAESGIQCVFLSNNHAERVQKFNEELQLPAYWDSHKPLGGQYKKVMAKYGAKKEECAVLGDQIFTDILAGNLMGFRSYMVPPIKDKTNLFFRFKRLLERPVLRRYRKKQGYLPCMNFWHIKK